MHIREVVVEDDKGVADAGTLTVDLNIRDPITELLVRFTVTNESADVINVPPHMSIRKIELVDGGQTYFGLSGAQAIAAACFDKGEWPPSWYCDVPSSHQREVIPLVFGRYPGDAEFGFDPTKLVNPQIKITWADNALWATNENTIGITARVMEGVPSPARCLLWKEVEAWTSVGTGVHTVDIPTDYDIRRMMIRSYQAEYDPSTAFTQYKLSCDLDKLVLFDLARYEWGNIVFGMFGPFTFRQYFYAQNADHLHHWMGGRTMAIPTHSGTNILNFWCSGGSYSTVKMMTHAGAWVVADVAFEALIWGFMPQHAYGYQFGRNDVPETWFKARTYGDIDLKLTEGRSGDADSVAIQQPRSLP